MPRLPSLDIVYAATAFGTTFTGLVGLTAGIDSEVMAPAVLVGAVIVGMISIYWLLGRGNPYGGV